DHRFRKRAGTLRTAAAAGADRARPVRCRARHHMRAREVTAQTFAGLQLIGRDQRTSVTSAPAREPHQRTFGFVDSDVGRAVPSFDPLKSKRKMLTAEFVNGGVHRLGRTHDSFLRPAFHRCTPDPAKKPRASSPHSSSSDCTTASIAGSSRRSSIMRQAYAAVVRSRPNNTPISLTLRPSTTWARYIAVWRANAACGDPRVGANTSSRGTAKVAATAVASKRQSRAH